VPTKRRKIADEKYRGADNLVCCSFVARRMLLQTFCTTEIHGILEHSKGTSPQIVNSLL